MTRPIGRSATSTRPSSISLDRLHLVVMQRQEEARQEFAVGVEPQPDGADCHVAPAQDRCLVEHRRVEDAVHETGGDEQPCGSVQRSPALVAAERAAEITHDRCIAGREHETPQRRRRHRLPSRQDRPERERHQADRPDHTKWPAERCAVRVRRQQHVRSQQDQAGDRNTAMPDCRLVDPVEPLLNPRQRADENEPNRKEQDRLCAQQLPDVARGGLPGRPRDDPEDGLR